jgi:tRNA pseudouridine55 synthase
VAKKGTPPPLGGVILVDKPAGITSHDVIQRLRHALSERQIGHGGTLDPDATGLLVVAAGRTTRLLRYVGDLDKVYVGEVVFGTATASLDSSGVVTATFDMDVTPDDVAKAAKTFVGDIEQVPPMVSALKVGGKRLHELAREGIEVERAPRPVTITSFETSPTADPLVYAITVACSSGTYVRSLAADLGEALGGGAHLRALRRTRIGGFTVGDALALDEVTPDAVRPPLDLVGHLDRVAVDGDVVERIRVGQVLARETLGVSGDGPWAVVSDGRLLGVYEVRTDDTVKPSVILEPA